MDIGAKAGYPASALSNFAPQPFEFDGVLCNSREGALQAFKYDKVHIQIEVCTLTGLAAKRRDQRELVAALPRRRDPRGRGSGAGPPRSPRPRAGSPSRR